MTAAIQFILKRYNDRTDEYGGSLENRVRIFREMIEHTKDAVGDTCAVAVRFAVDELLGKDGLTHQGEGYNVVAMLAELPDLWDVNVSGWSNDSVTSRFAKEGHQEKYISFVKQLTTKPVVGVGRYTSPDSIVSAIQRGVMDMIGNDVNFAVTKSVWEAYFHDPRFRPSLLSSLLKNRAGRCSGGAANPLSAFASRRHTPGRGRGKTRASTVYRRLR